MFPTLCNAHNIGELTSFITEYTVPTAISSESTIGISSNQNEYEKPIVASFFPVPNKHSENTEKSMSSF